MFDLITMGETMVCFLPESSEPLRYVDRFKKKIAGAESNVAIAMAKLGYRTAWMSAVGNDEFGAFVKNSVRAEGVNTDAVISSSDHPTGLMFKQLQPSGETAVQYYRKGSACAMMQSCDIDLSLLINTKIFHLSGIDLVIGKRATTKPSPRKQPLIVQCFNSMLASKTKKE